MIEPMWIMIAAAGLAGLAMLTLAALRAWNGWLEHRRLEIEGRREGALPPSAAARIEIADLRERVRKLEALAAGVEW